MFVDFCSLDLSSRVWIFQSETEINKNLEDLIKKELTEFLENWVSHGIDIISSFEISIFSKSLKFVFSISNFIASVALVINLQ